MWLLARLVERMRQFHSLDANLPCGSFCTKLMQS
jgi:hypothetical protein